MQILANSPPKDRYKSIIKHLRVGYKLNTVNIHQLQVQLL